MGSLTQSKLPVINVENLKPGTESWILTRHKVKQALEEYGCFMAVIDGFSEDFNKQIHANSKTIFDLPEETKKKVTSDNPFHGYTGRFHTRPLHESMGMEHATSLDEIKKFANQVWPSGNDQFSETMHSYANIISKLESQVRQMVFESYGVEKYYDSFGESITLLLKLHKYTPPTPDQTNIGAKAHTDKSFITILAQNHSNGLEVQIKDDEWISVDFVPSSVIVMASDPLMAWSNGRIKSPLHRVVINTQEDRYSVGLFSFKKGLIEIPEELVDEEHPPKFKPFDHFKFLDFYAKDPRFLDQRIIELFCGNELITAS